MAEEKTLNLFVSSPGDVQSERERVDFVVARLNAEFAGRARIRTIRWETRYYSSHETFQTQIPEAAACDLVVAIFGARLGSPLPARFPPMPTGEPYPSGTAYEVLSAIEARRHGEGVPDIYVFRRPRAPLVALDASDRADIEAQWRRLTEFFEKWFRNRSGEFLAAFQEFSTTDEFAVKVEDCLRQWLARRGFVAKGAVWDRARLGSPFPGLAAFDEGRQSVFFGRGLVVDQAIRRLREVEAPPSDAHRAPFLLIIGASGSGKSSLLRAGLAPRLVLPGAFPEVDLWRRAMTIPGADPFASLAESLLAGDALGPELAQGPFRVKELLAKQLAGDPDAATAPLRDALDRAAAARQAEEKFEAPRPARLLLGVDQAERLLTETEAGLAQRFCALLSALARHRVATLVLALRSDAYARFQSIDSLVALRDAGATLDLLPPSPSELEEMTTRPVALCDPPLSFEQKDGRSLAAQLVADARGGDALPLLQMTLSRLSAAEAARGDGVLRFADYHGMDEAVTETANEALAGLEASARGQLPDLITGLVRDVAADPLTGATTPVIGALDRARFEAGRPERTALVEAFVAKRLLTAEGDAASRRVRPTHEALLRIWPEAVAIIAEAAHLIRVRHALEPIAREWAEAPPEDKARHLDISPALLDGAERYVERFGAEASQTTRDFVAAASAAAQARRDRERQEQERRLADAEAIAAANKRIARRTGIGLVAALALAGLAGWQWIAADSAKKDAQAQRDRAENALRLATKTANDLVFDLAQRFRSATGMPVAIVKDVLDRARALQRQLVNSGESTRDLTASVASAQLESAITLLDFGDSSGALALARQSYATLAPVVAAEPSNVVGQRNLAVTDNVIGGILTDQGDLDGALAQYSAALAIDDALAKAHPDDPAILRERSIALGEIAKVQKARNDLPAALQAFRDGLALSEKLVAADPADVASQRDIGVAHASIGDVETTQGQIASALDDFRQAQAIFVKLSAAAPSDGGLKGDVALAELKVGAALEQLGQFESAFAALQDAAALRRALARAAPDNATAQSDYAEAELDLGLIEIKRGDGASADATLRDAYAIASALSARDIANSSLKRLLSRADEAVGKSLLAQGDLPGALDSFKRGLAITTALAAQAPKDAVPAQDAVLGALEVGDVEKRLGDDAEAEAAYRDALASAQKLIASDPTNAVFQDYAVGLNLSLGDVAQARADAKSALADYSQALTAAKALAAKDAGAAAWRHNILLADNRIGALTLSGGDADGALSYLREAQTLASALVAADAGDTEAQYDLADSDEAIAKALSAKGDDPGALAAMGEARTAREALVARAPGDARFVAALGAMFVSLGDLDAKAKRSDEAIAAFRQAVAIFAKRAADAPKDFSAADGLAVAQDHLRLALRNAGDARGSLAAAQAAYQARKSIVALTPISAAAQRGLSVAAAHVGYALERTNDLNGAIGAYREALAAAKSEGALANPPQDWGQDVATADQWLGLALAAAKDADGALAAYRDGAQALAAMPAGDPPDAAWRILLAQLDWRIGVLLKARNDLVGALTADRSAEALLTAAAVKSAASVDESLAAVKEAIALVLNAQRDADGATAASAEAIRLRKAVAQREPSDSNLRALAADELGVCAAKAAGGGAVCQDAANDARQAASRAPDDANAQFAFHASLNALGAAQAKAGDSAGAEATLRESLALAIAWAGKAPSDTRWRFGVVIAAERLGVLQFTAKAYDDALASFVAARDAAAALVDFDKANPAWAASLARSVSEIGGVANAELFAKNYAGALAALDKATPVAPEQNWLDLIRAASLMFQGRADEARALYLKHRGETTFGGKSWEQATTEGFALLRANGQSDPLMDEIEALFAAPK